MAAEAMVMAAMVAVVVRARAVAVTVRAVVRVVAARARVAAAMARAVAVMVTAVVARARAAAVRAAVASAAVELAVVARVAAARVAEVTLAATWAVGIGSIVARCHSRHSPCPVHSRCNLSCPPRRRRRSHLEPSQIPGTRWCRGSPETAAAGDGEAVRVAAEETVERVGASVGVEAVVAAAEGALGVA